MAVTGQKRAGALRKKRFSWFAAEAFKTHAVQIAPPR